MESLLERLANALGLTVLNLLLTEVLLGESLSVRVKTEHDLLVDKRVLLLDVGALSLSEALGGVEHGLNLRGVDEAGDISVGNDVGRQEEVLLQGRSLSGAAVDLIKSLESGRRPDDETAQVTTRSKLEEVEGEDGRGLNTGDVAEGLDDVLAIGLRVVDDEGTTALAVTATTELTVTGAQLAGLLDLLQIGTSTNTLQESDGSLGLSKTLEGLGLDNERNLRDLLDAVAAGEEESSDGGGGKRRSNGEALLSEVDLLLPSAPDLGGGEHATGTTLVTEGSLTGAVSTATRDTGDTSDSTA